MGLNAALLLHQGIASLLPFERIPGFLLHQIIASLFTFERNLKEIRRIMEISRVNTSQWGKVSFLRSQGSPDGEDGRIYPCLRRGGQPSWREKKFRRLPGL